MIFNKQWNKFAGKNIISERGSFFITFEKQPLSNYLQAKCRTQTI